LCLNQLARKFRERLVDLLEAVLALRVFRKAWNWCLRWVSGQWRLS
jgi:hypothetical protein